MAARARKRRLVAEAEERRQRRQADLADDRLRADRPWLHGWPRMGRGTSVLIGTSVHCVGCGRFHGVTCVVFPDRWEAPGPDPEWPFGEVDCPVCYLEGER
jgi:hypothetical protein